MDPYQRNEFSQGRQFDPEARQEPRKGCSCLTIFLVFLACGFLGCAGLCGGVYYVIFHSSYPLAQIEEVLESSGDIEVEGLSGSISSGFHIDQLRFRNTYDTSAELADGVEQAEDKWSTLEDIDFEFNGIWDLVNEQRFIVDRFTVGKGEIYYSGPDDSPTDDEPADGDPFPEIDEQGDETQPAGTEDEILKELRIDLVEFSDLKFIDTDTGEESKLGRFAIKDFHYAHGELQNMGVVEIEDLVTKGEEFEVAGLSGSTESGFQVERLAFKGEDENWSYLDDIEFQFNGVSDLIENQKLIITRFSVASGEIYVDGTEISADAFGDEGEPDDATDDLSSIGGTKLNEMQIDLLQFANLKLINPVSGVEFTVDEISVKDLKYEGDRLTGLGRVTIAADHLEFQEGPSTQFADQPEALVTRNFTGIVRSAMHESILSDISFDVDVCFLKDGTVMHHANLFDGKMVHSSQGDTLAGVVFQDFTPTDYLRWKHGLLPANLSGEITGTADAEDPQKTLFTISPGSKFQLGEIPFVVKTEQFVLDETADVTPPILASHATETGEIRCRVYGLKEQPYWAFQLESDDQQPAQQLFASVFFNKPFDALTAAEKATLEKMIQAAERVNEEP